MDVLKFTLRQVPRKLELTMSLILPECALSEVNCAVMSPVFKEKTRTAPDDVPTAMTSLRWTVMSWLASPLPLVPFDMDDFRLRDLKEKLQILIPTFYSR